jgi:gamma-D-glutamyl-L-lysine dipeptidyl-peptidase
MPRMFCLIMVLFGWWAPLRAQEVSVAQESPPIGPLPMKRVARKIEPDLKGRPERVQQYVDFFRRELVNDPRLIAFDVVAEAKGERGVALQGCVEFPESRNALVKLFEALGFMVDDRLESLPAENLGEKRYAIVKASHTLSYDRPKGRRAVVTDCLIGEPIYLLREDSDHFLIHSGEGYLGYVRAADVHRMNAEEFAKYMEGPRVRVISDLEPNDELANNGRLIPAGARLKYLGTEKHAIAETPGAGTVMVPEKHCEVQLQPAKEIDAVVANAKGLLDTRYFWGGKTSNGVDCSGLVQIAFATVGLNLPRDSYQQFYLGQLTATRWHRAGMRRGDTLYFLGKDGKIRHTALYLGDDQFIQAVVPRVTISSFNPEHDNYDEDHAKSFAFAKRLVE